MASSCININACPQVADYSCYLKMDAGEEVLRAQARLLKVFLMIGGRNCSEYINALVASLLLWGHYESEDHPCWQMFRENASAFNEESGEISLSLLARELARTGVRSDLPKVSRSFSLVKAKAEVAQDIGVDIAGDDFGSDLRGRELKTDSQEVASTAAFFATVIRHVEAGSYRHYDDKCGVLPKGATSARVTVPMQAFTPCFRSVAPDLAPAVDKLRKSTESFWVAPHEDIWAGAVPSVVFESDKSDEDEGADGDAAAAQGQGQKKKRKAKSEASGEPVAKKKKADAGADWIGRVMAVPAWKFGREWAALNFQDPKNAVLIGDIIKVEGKSHHCAMREDEGFVLKLSRAEVQEFLLEGAEAASAEDTPFDTD